MTEKQKGIIALLIVALSWGILPIFPKFLSQSFGVYQQLYLRIGVALVSSLLFFHKSFDWHKLTHIPRKDIVLLVLRSACYWIIGAGAMTASLLLTQVSNVMFIQALPMYAVFGAVLLHEKFTREKLGLVVLSFFGVLMVSVNDVTGLMQIGYGELLSFISVLAFSFSLVARKWHTSYLSDREISITTLFFAFLLTILTSVVVGEGMPKWNGDMGVIGIIILSGGIIAVMNYFLQYAYKRVEAIITGPILSLETVLSIIFAYVIFHEMPPLQAWIGGFIILASGVTMHIIEYRLEKANNH